MSRHTTLDKAVLPITRLEDLRRGFLEFDDTTLRHAFRCDIDGALIVSAYMKPSLHVRSISNAIAITWRADGVSLNIIIITHRGWPSSLIMQYCVACTTKTILSKAKNSNNPSNVRTVK